MSRTKVRSAEVPAKAAARPRRTRRSAEATRELMLRAGTRLAVDRLREADEDAAARALAHIRLTDVAKVATEIERTEAGRDDGAITTGAIYQLWSSQAAFQADLMVHVLTEAPLPSEDELTSRALELVAAGGPVEDMFCELVVLAYRRARAEATYDLQLLFVPYSGLPRVGEALRQSYGDQERSSRPLYEALLTSGGLEVRPPWELADMMTSISALHDGFRIQEHSGSFDGESEHGEQVVAEASLALFRAFTQPSS